MEALIKPNDLAARLGVSRTWLYDAARDGRVPSIRVGGEHGPLRFVAEDIDRWINQARSEWRPGGAAITTHRRARTKRPQRPADRTRSQIASGQQELI